MAIQSPPAPPKRTVLPGKPWPFLSVLLPLNVFLTIALGASLYFISQKPVKQDSAAGPESSQTAKASTENEAARERKPDPLPEAQKPKKDPPLEKPDPKVDPKKEAKNKPDPKNDPKEKTEARTEPKPDPKSKKDPPPKESGLEPLIAKLKSSNDAERISACGELSKMGSAAKPAAGALCEAALSNSENARVAALEALEKVHPAIYKPVLTLIVDQNGNNHIKANETLLGMGEEGKIARPVVKAHFLGLRKLIDGRRFYNNEIFRSDVKVLSAWTEDDPDLLKAFSNFSAAERLDPELREMSVSYLGELGKKPEHRQPIVSIFIPLLNDSKSVRLDILHYLALYGPDAKEAIPKLKKLKLHSDENVREAAGKALEQIDKN